jgi:hypothetical protein
MVRAIAWFLATQLALGIVPVVAQEELPVTPVDCTCVFEEELVAWLRFLTGANPTGEPEIDWASPCVAVQVQARDMAWQYWTQIQATVPPADPVNSESEARDSFAQPTFTLVGRPPQATETDQPIAGYDFFTCGERRSSISVHGPS